MAATSRGAGADPGEGRGANSADTAKFGAAELRQAPSPLLRALTSSALAIPGFAAAGGATADTPTDRANADYRYSFYTEDALANEDSEGTTQRFDIDIHQFHVEAPLTARSDFRFDVVYEAMSGASPSHVVETPQGPSNLMTGASIEDERVDLLGKGNYFFDQGRMGLAGGYSFEKDYKAYNASIDGERHFFDKSTTVSAATGFSYDLVAPVDGGNISGERAKASNAVSLGLTQIIDRYTALQTNVAYQNQRGYLSHAYKQISFVSGVSDPRNPGTVIPDARPNGRHQVTWLTQLRRHFGILEGSLHLDYRLYADDWGVLSHTIEGAWHQTLFGRIQVVPSLRYYTQSQADFYSAVHSAVRSDGHYSSDYRLSPYGALSWKIKAATGFTIRDTDWYGSLSWERYLSNADYALGSVSVANPGLVSFHLISVGLTAKF